MKKYSYEMHRNFPVGREITNFIKGSWQEEAHNSGRRFFEPLPAAERPTTNTVAQKLEPELARPLLAQEVDLTLVKIST